MRLLPLILAAVLVTVAHCRAENKALAHVESGNKAHAVGDGGKALGKYQFHAAAWKDTTAWRKSRGLAIHPYSKATNPTVADAYARSRLEQLKELFKAETGRAPSYEELYATWNLGLSGFKRRGFDLKKCPAITQRAAKLFAEKSRSGNL